MLKWKPFYSIPPEYVNYFDVILITHYYDYVLTSRGESIEDHLVGR